MLPINHFPRSTACMATLEPDPGPPSPSAAVANSNGHQHDDSLASFTSLISSLGPQRTRPATTKFVKKLESIPEISLPPSVPRKATISITEKGLDGQFTGLWLSPKTVQKWVERN